MNEEHISPPGDYFGEVTIDYSISQDGVRTYRIEYGDNEFIYLSDQQIEAIYAYQQKVKS